MGRRAEINELTIFGEPFYETQTEKTANAAQGDPEALPGLRRPKPQGSPDLYRDRLPSLAISIRHQFAPKRKVRGRETSRSKKMTH